MDTVLLSAFAPLRSKDFVLDAGTGSGTLLLCLGYFYQGISGVGIDFQSDILQIAHQNFKNDALIRSRHFSTCVGDIRALPFSQYSFDHVVTNPPYGTTHNQTKSLSIQKQLSHQSDYALRFWIEKLIYVLKPEGCLSMILHASQLPEAFIGMKKVGALTLLPLITKPHGLICRFLVTGKKGRKTAPRFLSPLVLNCDNGQPTPFVEEILKGEAVLTHLL